MSISPCVAPSDTSCVLAGRLLRRFIEFAEHARADYITTELALKWATQPAHAQPSQWANRLGMVRRFARYCSANDLRTAVPPPDLLPHRYRRVAPYIYRDEEIIRLLKAARRLPSAIGLRPHTFATLFGLYVASGLRANEALRLDRDDVDLVNGVLTIRDTKFGKSRYVPVHPSTQHALQRYAKLRDRLCPTPSSSSFFLSDRGTRVTDGACGGRLSKCLIRSACAAHVTRADPVCMVYAIDWPSIRFSSGITAASMSSVICQSSSTYLGHAHVTDTLLVSHRDAEAAALRAAAGGAIRAQGQAMKAPSTFPHCVQAFFMDRLMRQRQASPHTIASYRDTFRLLLQYAQQRLGKAPSQLTRAGSGHAAARRRSSIILSKNARTAPAVATFASPLSIPSSAMWHCMHRSTALWRSACWPCRANAMCVARSAFSRRSKSTLCSPRRTSPPGAGAVIGLCCCWPSRRDCARRNSPAFAVRTSCLAPARTFNAWAKDARAGARRFAKRPSPCCAVGCENVRGKLPIRSFQPHEAGLRS